MIFFLSVATFFLWAFNLFGVLFLKFVGELRQELANFFSEKPDSRPFWFCRLYIAIVFTHCDVA